MSNKRANEIGTEVRNQDSRNQQLTRKRQNINPPNFTDRYALTELEINMATFLDKIQPLDKRSVMLKAALQFLRDDESNFATVRQMLAKPRLLELMKETVYDEDLPPWMRELALQVLAQMLDCTYQLCEQLLKLGMLEFMVTLTKVSHSNRQASFFVHSLTGLGHLVGHKQSIREQLMAEGIDKLLPDALADGNALVFRAVAYFLNTWFRDRMQPIPIPLYLGIGRTLLKVDLDMDYGEDIIWFFYQFIAQSMDQLSPAECINFVDELQQIGLLPAFLQRKLQELQTLVGIAAVRLLTKLIRSAPNGDRLAELFEPEVEIVVQRCAKQETNMMKMEGLKLLSVVVQKLPTTILIQRNFDYLKIYCQSSQRIQRDVLQILHQSDCSLLSEEQCDYCLDICRGILSNGTEEAYENQKGALTLLMKLPQKSAYLLKHQLENLLYSKNKEIYELTETVMRQLQLEIE